MKLAMLLSKLIPRLIEKDWDEESVADLVLHLIYIFTEVEEAEE